MVREDVVLAVCYTVHIIYISLCTQTAETTSPEPFSWIPLNRTGKEINKKWNERKMSHVEKKRHPVIYFPVWLFSVLHLCVSGEGWGEEPLVGQGFEPQHVFAGQRGAPQPHRVHYWLNLQKEILNKLHEARGRWWRWAFAPVTGGDITKYLYCLPCSKHIKKKL